MQANILIDSGGCAKLSDFGLSQIRAEFAEPETMTSLSGSCRYWASELVSNGGSQPTFQSDVYAFACVAYEVGIISLCLYGNYDSVFNVDFHYGYALRPPAIGG